MSGRATTGLVELVIRLVLLVGYVLAISRMQEIQRVLQYHGAEHKVLWAWENNHAAQGFRDGTWDHVGVVNTLADVAKDAPRLHPRCGTSFLFLWPFAPGWCTSLCRLRGCCTGSRHAYCFSLLWQGYHMKY